MENERKERTSRGIDPNKFGLWRGCDEGYYAPSARCLRCGKAHAEHLLSGVSASQSQRDSGKALDGPPEIKKSLLRIDGACRVRITRGHGPAGPLDRDNLFGACKKLRDEIAAKILGLADDAESETLEWEYAQKPGSGTLVEIFEVNTNETKKE